MPKHLLTIDDEEEIRNLLSYALTAAGYRVTGASSTVEALRVVRDDPPDLIITDLQLIDSDGFDLVDQIKSVRASIPIIMLTGVLMNPAEIPAVISQKIACYIPKTTSLEEILKEVRRCLG